MLLDIGAATEYAEIAADTEELFVLCLHRIGFVMFECVRCC